MNSIIEENIDEIGIIAKGGKDRLYNNGNLITKINPGRYDILISYLDDENIGLSWIIERKDKNIRTIILNKMTGQIIKEDYK